MFLGVAIAREDGDESHFFSADHIPLGPIADHDGFRRLGAKFFQGEQERLLMRLFESGIVRRDDRIKVVVQS